MGRILIIIACFLFISCANPKLTNWERGRFNYYDNEGFLHKKNHHERSNDVAQPLNHPVIDVSVAAVPIPKVEKAKKETKKITDFTEKVQLALIKKLTDDPVKNKILIDALKEDYSKVEIAKEVAEKDYTDIKVRLYFSNVKKYFNDARLMHPNTRLAFLNTIVTIGDGSNMTFQSVDKIENEFEIIDMGKLERSQDVNFNSKLSGDIAAKVLAEDNSETTNNEVRSSGTKSYDGEKETSSDSTTNTYNSKNNKNNKKDFGAGAKAESSIDLKSNIKEAINVNFNRLKTGFSLNKNSLTISQQGSLLRDINDVTIVTVSFEFDENAKKKEDVIEFFGLFDTDGKPNEMNKVTVKVNSIKYYPCSNKIISDQKIKYTFEGAIRAPKNLKRGKNILEYDDKVNYFAFDSNCLENKNCCGETIGTSNTIDISKFTFCKQVFKIKVKNKLTGETNILQLLFNGDKFVPHFEGKEAYNFLDWLKAISGMKYNLNSKESLFKLLITNRSAEQFKIEDFEFELEDIDK